ncbi:MAG: DUF5723 family protein [Prolixibacteraceae bacterium]
MKKTINIIFAVCILVISDITLISAQESTTLQFMKGMPQSDLQNPALHNDSSKVVIGLPGLSGAYFDFNSPFAVNDVIHKGTGMLADSLVVDIDRFYNKLGNTNPVQQHMNLPLFYLGIRSKKSFYSLGVTFKEIAQFSFEKSLVAFIKDGNDPYLGQNYNLGDLTVNSFGYSEIALGYSNEVIRNKLTIGAKVKALYGNFAAQTERMNVKVETAADGSSLSLKTDMKINLASPLTVEYDQDGYFSGMNSDNIEPTDVIMQTDNFGLAFDLGAVYKVTPKLNLSASIIDIGKISFKNNVDNFTKSSSYNWSGIDFSNSIDKSGENYVNPSDIAEGELDKMESTFKPKKSDFSSNAFDVKIPTKIFIGGTYEINDKFNVGILDRLYKFGNTSTNSVTLSGNAFLGNFFSLTGSYSIIGNSNNNIGLGAAFRLGFMQLYLVSDNLLSLNDPAKAQFVNARFGMNFLFGRKHKPKMVDQPEIQ